MSGQSDIPTPGDDVDANAGHSLLACPFCGSIQARTTPIRDGREVSCFCGAAGKPCFHGPLGYADTDVRAIAAWNTRTPPTIDPALFAEMVAALREVDRLTMTNRHWDFVRAILAKVTPS